MTTLVLAEDHHVVREGLRALLESQSDFSVVGEEANGLEVADLVQRLQPDILLLDIMMPGLNGMEITRLMQQRSPETKVLILSMYANEGYVLEALKNGAAGYVLKGSTAADLVQAVRLVAGGGRYLSPSITERGVEAYLQRAEGSGSDGLEILTDREREVLHFVVEGYRNAEIASRLSISPRTVEAHRARLMSKLGLHTQAELINYAIRRGILTLED